MISSLLFGVGSILAAVANSFTLVYVFATNGRLLANFAVLSGDPFKELEVVES